MRTKLNHRARDFDTDETLLLRSHTWTRRMAPSIRARGGGEDALTGLPPRRGCSSTTASRATWAFSQRTCSTISSHGLRVLVCTACSIHSCCENNWPTDMILAQTSITTSPSPRRCRALLSPPKAPPGPFCLSGDPRARLPLHRARMRRCNYLPLRSPSSPSPRRSTAFHPIKRSEETRPLTFAYTMLFLSAWRQST